MVMARRFTFSLALFILMGFSPVLCLPSGAPSGACSDLRPQHGGIPQTSTSPYELDVDMFEDIAVPGTVPTYSYTPSSTYNRKSVYR